MSDTTPTDDDDTTPTEDDGGFPIDAAATGAAGVPGEVADRAKDLLDRAREQARDRGSSIVAAASGASASTDASDGPIVAATTAVPRDPGASAHAAAGGPDTLAGAAGGAGSGGAGGGSGTSDDEGLFDGLPISGTNQVIWLGLVTAGVLFFGAAVWSFLFGTDESDLPGSVAEVVEASSPDLSVGDELNRLGAADSTPDSGNDLSTGASDDPAPATTATPTTSTAAPTTTTEAPTTTTEAPTTSEAAAAETTTSTAPPDTFTMWDALNESGQATQFATVGGVLGLRDALEDPSIDRTLFAPSDAALAALDPAVLESVVSDPDGSGSALVGYHFVDQRLSADDLIALDGQEITTLTGLPIRVSVVEGQVTLNGATTVVGADFAADNGVVHVIDAVLSPPTVNEVLGLQNIEFEVNSAVITASGREELQKAVEFFTANPDLDASIEGHTDTDGSEDLNLALSQDRASAVRDFLIAAGLDGERFTATGFGESRPILVDGVEDKAASRRIEFIIS